MGHLTTVAINEVTRSNTPRTEMSSFSDGNSPTNRSNLNSPQQNQTTETNPIADQQKRDSLSWGDMFSGLFSGVKNLVTSAKPWQEMGTTAMAVVSAIGTKIGDFFTGLADPKTSGATLTNALSGLGGFVTSVAKTIWTDFGGDAAMKGNYLDAVKYFFQTATGYTDFKNGIIALMEGNPGMALIHFAGGALQLAGVISLVAAGWTGGGAVLGLGLMAARNALYAGGKEALIAAGKTAVKEAVVTVGKETISEFTEQAMTAGFKQVSKEIATDLVQNVAKQEIRVAYREIAERVGKGSMQEAIERSSQLTSTLIKKMDEITEAALKRVAESKVFPGGKNLEQFASDKAYKLVMDLQKAADSDAALKLILKNEDLKKALLKQGFDLDKFYNPTALRKTLADALYGKGKDQFKQDIIDQITESFTTSLTAQMRREFEQELRIGLTREADEAFRSVLGRQMTKEERELFVEKTVNDVGEAFQKKADDVLRPYIKRGVEDGFKRAREERNKRRNRDRISEIDPTKIESNQEAYFDTFISTKQEKFEANMQGVDFDTVAKENFYGLGGGTDADNALMRVAARNQGKVLHDMADSSSLLALANEQGLAELSKREILQKIEADTKRKFEAASTVSGTVNRTSNV